MAKRPRLPQSPSTGEVELALPPPLSSDVDSSRRSPERKATKTSDQTRASIFSISTPADGDPKMNFGFLEECHFCRGKISPGRDVFMYRDLRGFCSVKCREWQMFIEGTVNKVAAKRAKKDAP